jgi:hypothetical protein
LLLVHTFTHDLMHVPEELATAAAALRRDLEPHFSADTCVEGPEQWSPARPVIGHNWPVALVAYTELPRRTGMPVRWVVTNTQGEDQYMLRVSGPAGDYDVDLTADCRGEAPPVWIAAADPFRNREATPFVSIDAHEMGLLLAARAGIVLD